MRGGRSGMDDGGAGGMNRDMTSGGGRGGYSGRGGYHQGYRGGSHGAGGMLGRGGEVGQGEHLAHGGPPAVFKPAPEFEMKGNDFPALPGLDEPRKVSESSDGGSKPWESEKRYHIQYHMEKRSFSIFNTVIRRKLKKSRAKKLVKSNTSISQKDFFLTKYHFLQF